MITKYEAMQMRKKVDKLEDTQKELLFRAASPAPAYLFDFVKKYNFDNFDKCKTPIEVLFYMAFEIINHKKANKNEYTYKGKYDIKPQVDIMQYTVDFLIQGKTKQIVVETDGHDFHSTKEQIAYDNKRQNELTLAGYTVMRISGSQLVKNAMAEALVIWKACAL